LNNLELNNGEIMKSFLEEYKTVSDAEFRNNVKKIISTGDIQLAIKFLLRAEARKRKLHDLSLAISRMKFKN
jgi:hypothetical protein